MSLVLRKSKAMSSVLHRNKAMSPVDQILGRGAVAELCVWNNKMISGFIFVMATIIWYVLEIMETRLVPVICSILFLLMLLLFIWVKFGQLLFTRRPLTPEEIKKRGSPVRALLPKIERLFLMLYEIAYGAKDIKTSLWALLYVAIIHTIGRYINLATILYICLVSSMTIPVLYLQYQVAVDNFIGEVSEVKNKTLELFKSRATKKKKVTLQTPTANTPSTSTANEPSTSTANGPSTSTVNDPSTSTANGPSTPAANGPSTPAANGPSASTANGPSASTAKGPSASTANGPLTPTANGPSLVNGPSTPRGNGPSTPKSNGPSTPTDDGPCPHHPVRKSRLFSLFRRSVR